jgi:hypothetical protein
MIHGKIPRIINYPDVLRREYSKTDKLIQWPNEKGQKDKQLSIKDNIFFISEMIIID